MAPLFRPPSMHVFESALEAGVAALWERSIQGEGVTVALLDSGVDEEKLGALADQVSVKVDLTGSDDATDSLGHGTMMCNLILGYGPKSKIASIRVVDRNGLTDRAAVASGIDWCLEHRDSVRVVNISLSIRRRYLWRKLCTSDQPCELCQKTNEAVSKGLIIVAAAGNSGPRPGGVGCPGAADRAWTVGAVGKKPHWTGRLLEKTIPWIYYRLGRGAIGTSVATALSSGGLALILSDMPEIPHADLGHALSLTATQIPGAPPEAVGAGREHAYRAYKLLKHKECSKPFNPELAYQQFQQGKAFLEQGYLDDAHEQFQYSVQYAPTSSAFHNELGLTYLQKRNYPKAFEMLWEAARLDWQSELAHNNLGLVFEQIGEKSLARFHYESAIRLAPGLQTARNNLYKLTGESSIAEKSNRLQTTIDCWLRAAELFAMITKGGTQDVQNAPN